MADGRKKVTMPGVAEGQTLIGIPTGNDLSAEDKVRGLLDGSMSDVSAILQCDFGVYFVFSHSRFCSLFCSSIPSLSCYVCIVVSLSNWYVGMYRLAVGALYNRYVFFCIYSSDIVSTSLLNLHTTYNPYCPSIFKSLNPYPSQHNY